MKRIEKLGNQLWNFFLIVFKIIWNFISRKATPVRFEVVRVANYKKYLEPQKKIIFLSKWFLSFDNTVDTGIEFFKLFYNEQFDSFLETFQLSSINC